ncbi:MAG: ABC transporter substrate-binding protein [Bradyrhizobium sp.]
MRRRDFISLFSIATIAGVLAGAPISAAQSIGKVWRIGYLSGRHGPSDESQSLVDGLRELGYVEGRNLIMEYRFAEGKNERLRQLAVELVRVPVDIIITEGTPPTFAARQATRTIPIVFGSMQDPIEKGIIARLSYPGGNVTGNALIGDHTKPLALLKEAVPTVSKVAFIYDPLTRPGAYGEAKLKEMQEHASALNVLVRPLALRAPELTDEVFAALPADTNGLVFENSVVNLMAQARLCELGAQRRLPTVGAFPGFSRSGCLMSYGENLPLIYRHAAIYVDKILKGADVSNLPVEQATRFELVINLRAAKALGLTIPEAFLVRADEVIE